MKEGLHYSKDIEAAVIGICLLETTATGRIYGTLKPEMLYISDNQKVFQVICEMYDESKPIDILTVWQRLVQNGAQLNEPNILYYLTGLTMYVVNSAHLEFHTALIMEMYRRRELIRITSSGINESEDLKGQGYQLNEQINALFQAEQQKEWYSIDELMFNLLIHQNDIKEGKKKFIPSGFRSIDRMNGGFSPGQSIVLGARPSVGKSAMMNKIAVSIAKAGYKVGIVSLEMNNNEIAARLAALETDTDFQVVYRNLFRDENEHRKFYDTITTGAINLPLFVSDKTRVDVNSIRAKATKLKHKHGLDFLVIDYLQLIESTSTNKNYNREQEVSKISRGMKLLAMELEIPVMTLCQLNRSSTQRKGDNRYPQLSEFRESGAIEQDADIAMILHRDWMAGIEADEHGNSTEHKADLLGLKWRNGQPFHLELDFHPQLMKFSEPAHSQLIKIQPQRDDNEDNPF
jgi:replicative DNA helicase